MTLGERILLKRKEKGMSQEDLGFKLDVSRQTVHKWETDQAIPELNKLISLAEILDVSIGWLIIEESDEKNNEACDEVAEKITELVKRGNIKKDNTKQAIIGVFAGLVIFACVFGFIKINSLNRKYQDLERSIERSNAYVQQQINGISSNVSRMLNNYNSITVNTNTAISNIDFEKNTITFEVSALPKTYTSGMKTIFHINSGNDLYDFDGIERNDKSFVATCEIPLTNDEAIISVEFINGETSETNNITTYNELLASTFPWYDVSWPFDKWINDDYSGFNYDYLEVIEQNIYNYSDYFGLAYERPKIIKMEAFLTEDGIKIIDYKYDEEYTAKQNYDSSRPQPELPADGQLYVYWHEFKRPKDIKLTKGKKYLEHFIATDEYGRQIEVIADDAGREVKFHINDESTSGTSIY